MSKVRRLREEAQRRIQIAKRTADNKVAAALMAYACELEQRARLIENAKKLVRNSASRVTESTPSEALAPPASRRT